MRLREGTRKDVGGTSRSSDVFLSPIQSQRLHYPIWRLLVFERECNRSQNASRDLFTVSIWLLPFGFAVHSGGRGTPIVGWPECAIQHSTFQALHGGTLCRKC